MTARRALSGIIAASLLTLPVCAAVAGPAAAAPSSVMLAEKKTQRIVLDQGAPVLKVIESSDGDHEGITLFIADLTTNAGAAAGKMSGSITTIAGASNGAAGSARHRELVFDLPKGQLVAIGNSLYPEGSAEMDRNKPVTIAIVGGTGRYLGARGEVKTNRNADGTYRHVLTLLR